MQLSLARKNTIIKLTDQNVSIPEMQFNESRAFLKRKSCDSWIGKEKGSGRKQEFEMNISTSAFHLNKKFFRGYEYDGKTPCKKSHLLPNRRDRLK